MFLSPQKRTIDLCVTRFSGNSAEEDFESDWVKARVSLVTILDLEIRIRKEESEDLKGGPIGVATIKIDFGDC
jgi:hypothetical protein